MNVTKIETNIKRNLYFSESHPKFKESSNKTEFKVINIYSDISYQKFLGFGGAFTGSSSINYDKLPNNKKEQLINDYFGENGLGYKYGRLTIASSDFDKKSFSYASKSNLSDFNIENDKLIINMIHDAQKLNNDISFLASPWSPPRFMKSNKMLCLGGKLLNKYKQTYADYFVKYLKSYKNENIDIEFINTQNETNAKQLWESCTYTSEEEKDFILNYLAPTLKNNNLNTKILIWDHNKEKLYSRTKQLLDNTTKDIISGVAYHYYTGDHFNNIAITKEKYPNLLLIHTEGCCGYSETSNNHFLHNGEIYAHDIIGDLNHGSNAYIDWNLLLDYHGGPNHKHNFCHSPIMLNENNDDYIKHASYYYIGHFSKYIKPNSKRIAHSCYTNNIELTSFINTDNSIAIVLFNRNDKNYEYNLILNDNYELHDNLDAHAIVTYLIK